MRPAYVFPRFIIVAVMVPVMALVLGILLPGCHPADPLKRSGPLWSVATTDPRLDELSGIAASVLHPEILYVHNDSGDSARVFALDTGGRVKAVIYFAGDPAVKPLGVVDCEDIAVGIGPEAGSSYVYVGDIGDNDGKRKGITIYRFKEGAIADGRVSADPLVLHYPDGPRDAETLMVDPSDGLLYIVSKREDSVGVYSAPLYFRAHDTVTLKRETRLFFPGDGIAKYITAGDIARNGSAVVLKSYVAVYYWKRPAGEPLWKTLQGAPAMPAYTIEPQGEAIGFTPDGTGYYTISEGKYPRLYYYTAP